MAALSGLARRAGWNVVDQALAALSNMLLMVVVAREVDAASFGAFAIGFLVYGIAVAVGKALVGQPLQIRHSSDAPSRFRQIMGDAQGATFWLGVAGGVLTAAIGLVLGGSVGAALVAVAACLPGLLLQDVLRMAFMAQGRPERAALVDVVKALVQFGLLFALLGAGVREVGLLTLSWGVAALVSAGVGMAVLRSLPRLGRAAAWLREQRALSKYLLAEYTLGLGAAQFGALLVPVLGTPRDAGAIRGAQTLLGPLNVLGTAAFGFATPEVSRRADLGARRRVQAMLALSGTLAAVSTLYTVVLLLLPDAAGVQLFGDSWAGAQSVLLPMGINALASALGVGPGVMLLGMGLARKTFRINLAKAPILLGLLVPGTLYAGAAGAAWSLALSETLLLPVWWLVARRAAQGRYAHLADAPDAHLTDVPHAPDVAVADRTVTSDVSPRADRT